MKSATVDQQRCFWTHPGAADVHWALRSLLSMDTGVGCVWSDLHFPEVGFIRWVERPQMLVT